MKTIRKLTRLLLCFILALGLSIMSGCGSTDTEKKEEAVQADNAVNAEDYSITDLHLHLDGSISIESARELAKMQEITVPESDEELQSQLHVGEDCESLNEYLEKFDLPVSLLQTEEAISTAVYNLEKELQELGLIYAEIRFAPQKHMENGLTQAEVVEAAIDGMNKCDFRSNLILCCMRGDDNQEQNLETVHVAKKYLGKGVAAIDLAGAEALYPTKDFEDIFALADQLELPRTIHAGEADGPSSVYDALSFGAKRIGHGIRSIEDEELVKTLSQDGIALELCPTSNLNTQIFESLNDYPLEALMEAGVKVTINSDNMSVSGTNAPKELKLLFDTFELSEDQMKTIAETSIEVSFADDETKNWLYTELENRIKK